MTENSLVDTSGWSKTATVLVEKISDAVGGIFKPCQIVRVAKAHAEADRIRTESQIQIEELERRAMWRFLKEEAKKQANIEAITQKALLHLRDDSKPENVENDWITNFFDKSRIISNEEMQQLWSRVLADEANTPGRFSKQTVNILADLDKSDAELFMNLRSFTWTSSDYAPLIFDVQEDIYARNGINFKSLSHLESLGLLHFNNLAGFRCLGLGKALTLFYYGRPIQLIFPKDENNELDLGKVIFTRAGQQLASVCDSAPIDGVYDYIYKFYEKQNITSKI